MMKRASESEAPEARNCARASSSESASVESCGEAVRKLSAEILRFAQDDRLKFKSTPAGLKTGATVDGKG